MASYRGTGKGREWRKHYSVPRMKERFLIQLQDLLTIPAACEALDLDTDTVKGWRRVDEPFHEEVKDLLQLKKEGDSTPVFSGGLPHPDKYGKPARFVSRYQQTHSFRDACLFVGVRAHEVGEWRSPESDTYDKDFDEIMGSEELMDMYDVAEIMIAEARGRPPIIEDGKVLVKETRPDLKSAQFLLERRMRTQYGPPVQQSKVTHQHNLSWFTSGGAAHAKDINQGLMDKHRPKPAELTEGSNTLLLAPVDESSDPS